MSRQDDNRDLLILLSEIVEKESDLRFSQILYAYGFVEQDDEMSTQEKFVWKDEFNVEPSKILKRVSKALVKAAR
ncbi:MAG: hypothetical protein HRU19_13015 [Pseudobacteriovorax sp.]|nr:hypothetical protein [Pseudobacteriovorax sp.]